MIRILLWIALKYQQTYVPYAQKSVVMKRIIFMFKASIFICLTPDLFIVKLFTVYLNCIGSDVILSHAIRSLQ